MSWLKKLVLGTSGGKKGGSGGPTKVAESDYEKTSSGLQYYDIETGEGASPSKGNRTKRPG